MPNPNLTAGSGLRTPTVGSAGSGSSTTTTTGAANRPAAASATGMTTSGVSRPTTTNQTSTTGHKANPGKGTKDEEYVMPGQSRPTTADTTNGPSADKLAQVEKYLVQQNQGSGSNYTPSGSGGSGGGGSSSPSVDTDYDPYAAENAAAAATTSRIVNGVDMSEKINEANNAWQNATQGYGEQSGGILDQLANATNANINQYQGNAQGIIDQLSNVTGQQLADYAANTGQTIDQATTQIRNILAGLQDSLKPVEAGRVGRVDTTEQQNILQQMTDNQRQQANQQIDYTVNQGVNELTRALEDAAHPFQTQRNQIAANEAQAKDNQALYAEMRGDRGGIGQAQYDAIQNTAATNQLKVNQEQTKLSTDTARQIADLRAKGEFDKADKALEITQEMLKGLMQLKQWADETNLSVDEFNIATEKWEQETNARLQQVLGDAAMDAAKYEASMNLDKQQYLTNQGLNAANTQASQRLGLESDVNKQRQSLNDALASYGLSNAQYMTNQDINRLTSTLNAYMQNAQNMASTELAAANVTGALSDNTLTLANREAQEQRQAQAAQQMISAGVTPTDAQLKALGWSKDQYKAYKSLLDAAAVAASSRGGGGKRDTFYSELQDAIETGLSYSAAMQAIKQAEASGKHSSQVISQSRALVESGNKKGLLGNVS